MASLKIGSSSIEVRRLQEVLNLLIPTQPQLSVDGIFGPKTQARVLQFQQTSKLIPDGIVGPLTTKALVAGTLVATLKRR
jgi:peptidoglycan hydrolase-like protein with peptidoglycan-binding domain